MTLADIVATPLLVYGIGNVGRQDDGVGPLLVERLETAGMPEGVTLDTGYQLVPEDALALSSQAVVIFVDAHAAADAPSPYAIHAVAPALDVSISTHAMSMGALLALCERMYGRAPRAYALAIPGYDFQVNAELSTGAAANLDRAARELCQALQALVARRHRE